MASQPRYYENKEDPLLSAADPHAELLGSLEKLLTHCPPVNPWTHTSCPEKGLLKGPTSLAYLFLQLSRIYPDFAVKGQTAFQWCLRYLDCGQASIAQDAHGDDRVGVSNEYLAFRAVRAAATGDEVCIASLEEAVSSITAGPTMNEYLSGRAGLLVLLRIVSSFVINGKDRMRIAMHQIIQQILANAPWTFHGHEYIGAAHGSIGIISQIILSDPSYAKDPIVLENLLKLLDLQLEDGNWPTTPKHRLDLVQWCHGAPGFILSLLSIRKYVSEEVQARIDRAVTAGRECIWKYGLLTKEPNLCHGITGNAQALEGRQRDHFMAHSTLERIAAGLQDGTYIKGDDPWGLMWGEGGRAWGWLSYASGRELGYPAYTDI